MAYDPVRKGLLLFGGDGSLPCLFDLWIFSFAERAWTLLLPPQAPRPRGRWWTQLTVDGKTGSPWVFFGSCGGFQAVGDYLRFDNDLKEWTSFILPSAKPWRCAAHVGAYDSKNERILLFGGFIPGSVLVEEQVKEFTKVWSFDPATNSWEQLTSGEDRPFHRWAVGAYDPISELFLAYGGVVGLSVFGGRETVSHELLAFDPTSRQWSVLPGGDTPALKRWQAAGDYRDGPHPSDSLAAELRWTQVG